MRVHGVLNLLQSSEKKSQEFGNGNLNHSQHDGEKERRGRIQYFVARNMARYQRRRRPSPAVLINSDKIPVDGVSKKKNQNGDKLRIVNGQ